jgi:hypothetical protein
LHSDTIFSMSGFSFGSAIGSGSVRQSRAKINHEGGQLTVVTGGV